MHEYLSKFYRPNTPAVPEETNIVLEGGGLGDVLCWVTTVVYIAETHPHITGRVFVQTPLFTPLIENILKPYPKWSVYLTDELTDQEKQGKVTRHTTNNTVNATGFNLVDLGFVFLLNLDKCPDPEFNYYPRLDLSNVKSPLPVDSKHVVITIGATQENRALPLGAFNAIKKEVINQGLTPVFLGKRVMTATREIKFSDEFDLTGGVDLIDKTSLLVAAKILADAKAVVGLDNGLLHLAACASETVPIVFGYNIASPEHRRPKRRGVNPVFDVYPDEKELPCVGCQSHIRLIPKPNFDKCFYGDNKCLEILDQPEMWIPAMRKALGET